MTVEPDRPEGPLVISNVCGDSVTLSWKAPLDDGGSPLLSYLIEAKDVLDVDVRKTYFRIYDDCLEYVVTGLVNSHIYQFRVYAENESGRSDALVNKTLVKLKRLNKKPETPQKPKIQILDEEDDSIKLSWPGSESSNIEYIVERFDTDSNRWKQINRLPVLIESYNVQDLLPGIEYKFRVSAENRFGVSDPSEASESFLLSSKANDAPPHFTMPLQNYSAEENCDAIFYCEFIGFPTPQITWYKDGVRLQQGLYQAITCSNSNSKLILHEICEDDDGCVIRCQLSNSSGQISTEAELKMLKLPKIHRSASYNDGLLYDLGDTLRIKVGFSCNTSAIVKWYFNGVICKEDDKTDILIFPESTQIKVLEVTTKNTGIYTLKISNDFGKDVLNIPVSVLGAPNFPSEKPKITQLEPRLYSVTWTVPKYDGGSPITNYILETKENEEWIKVLSTNDTTAYLNDLLDDHIYVFRVKAINVFGCSDPSEESLPMIIPAPSKDEPATKTGDDTWHVANLNDKPSPFSIEDHLKIANIILHTAVEEQLINIAESSLNLEHSNHRQNNFDNICHQIEYTYEVQFNFLEVRDIAVFDTIVERKMENISIPSSENQFKNIPLFGTEFLLGAVQPSGAQSGQSTELEDHLIISRFKLQQAVYLAEIRNKPITNFVGESFTRDSVVYLNIHLIVVEPPILWEKTVDANNEEDQVKTHPILYSELCYSLHVVFPVLLENAALILGSFYSSFEESASSSLEEDGNDFTSSSEKLFVFTQCKPALSVLPFMRSTSTETDSPQPRSQSLPLFPDKTHEEYNQLQKKSADYGTLMAFSDHNSIFQENVVFPSSDDFADEELEELLLKYEDDYKRIKYGTEFIPRYKAETIYRQNALNNNEKFQEDIPPWLKQISPQYKFSIEKEESPYFQEVSSNSSENGSSKAKSVEELLELANEVELRFDQKAKDIEALEDILSGELVSLQKDLDLVSAIQHSVSTDSLREYMCSSIEDCRNVSSVKDCDKNQCHKDLIDFTEEIENTNEPKSATGAGYPPVVTTHLSNRVITAGCRTRLACYISSDPEARITWLKNNMPIPNKHRYIYSTLWDYGLCSLDIFNAKPSDSGEFTCVAENCHGIVLTQAYLRVAGNKDYSPDEPRFGNCPEDLTVKEGVTVVLEWKISGVPFPQVLWYKNAEKVESSLRVDLFNNHRGCCKLIIRDITTEDNAIYTCFLENDVGSALSTVLLSVPKISESPTNIF